ncbi:MAG: GSCFA domain-containing protein [Chitinophagaceae bacterium]
MDFMLNIPINPPGLSIGYKDKILVVGSCFTEHIGGRLEQLKFSILKNPNGILFDPLSVCKILESYIYNKKYKKEDLFQLNELWQSWQHHSKFSGLEQEKVLQNINESLQNAHVFLQKATWLIITLGSSFSYKFMETNEPVANCHRAPAKWFSKQLTSINEMIESFESCLAKLFQFNPSLKIIFTVSPVRHIRDGVIENNRSKARLIETVHQLIDTSGRLFYFPAYELVIDVLRDYRFYDIDLVHPNYAATEFVFEKFTEYYIDKEAISCMEEIRDLVKAFKHKPFQPATQAHRKFMELNLVKVQQLQQKYPHINFSREVFYFEKFSESGAKDDNVPC